MTVLFTHPCFTNMRPCPFFMDGRCKFGADNCRYSHGHVVPFSKLKPYCEPNYRYTLLEMRERMRGERKGRKREIMRERKRNEREERHEW